MNGCATRRLRRELEIYNSNKRKFMPNVIYDENKNTISYLNIILKIPKNYPFEAPTYHHEKLNVKNIKPGNIRALLFCGNILKLASVNLIDPRCCVYCSSLLCKSNYNISTSLTSFFAESIILYKYKILTSALHLKYVNKLFEFFPYDILQRIFYSF